MSDIFNSPNDQSLEEVEALLSGDPKTSAPTVTPQQAFGLRLQASEVAQAVPELSEAFRQGYKGRLASQEDVDLAFEVTEGRIQRYFRGYTDLGYTPEEAVAAMRTDGGLVLEELRDQAEYEAEERLVDLVESANTEVEKAFSEFVETHPDLAANPSSVQAAIGFLQSGAAKTAEEAFEMTVRTVEEVERVTAEAYDPTQGYGGNSAADLEAGLTAIFDDITVEGASPTPDIEKIETGIPYDLMDESLALLDAAQKDNPVRTLAEAVETTAYAAKQQQLVEKNDPKIDLAPMFKGEEGATTTLGGIFGEDVPVRDSEPSRAEA